jgi:C1A family cysteine protease
MEIRKSIPGPEEFAKYYTQMSRMFLYFNERALEGDTYQDGGAQLADGSNAIKKWGICKEVTWPYVEADLLTTPSGHAYAEGALHKISSSYKIADGDLANMKSCILSGYPFVFGIIVFDSFMSDAAAQTGIIPMPDVQTESVQGGHAITAVGYDDTKQWFICANSWGTDWGDKGYFYMPYEYVGNDQLASDFWTARR